MSQLPPTSTINSYLGLALDEQYEYISVSPETGKVGVEKANSPSDGVAKKYTEHLLFERVIKKLYGIPLEKDQEDLDVKAGIITERFYETLAQQNPLKLSQTYHCKIFADALRDYELIHFGSSNPLPETFEQPKVLSRQRQLRTSTPSFEAIFSAPTAGPPTHISSPRKNSRSFSNNKLLIPQLTTTVCSSTSEATPDSISNSPSPRRKSSGSSGSQQELKLSIPQLTTTASSSEASSEPIVRNNSSKRTSGLFTNSNIPSVEQPDYVSKESQERSPRSPQNAVIAQLSIECLDYCQLYWLKSVDKRFKDVAKVRENNITEDDKTILKKSKFLDSPKLGIVLQERVIRDLNNRENDVRLFTDCPRSISYVTILDDNSNNLFSYKNYPESYTPEKIAQHNCRQFKKFLSVVLSNMGGCDKVASPKAHTLLPTFENTENVGEETKSLSDRLAQLVLTEKNTEAIKKTWGNCVEEEKSSKGLHNQLVEASGVEFLKNLSKYPHDIAYKLRSLLGIFFQCTYVAPSSAIQSSLSELTCVSQNSNRSIKLIFTSASQVEVLVQNGMKFSREEQPFIDLIVENRLSGDLLDSAPWSSKITFETLLVPGVSENDVKAFVLDPLKKIGITDPEPVTEKKRSFSRLLFSSFEKS